MTEAKTVQDLARELANAFETRTRENGERFVALKEGSPDWMTEVIRDGAHAGASILPDDYRYQFALDAAELLAEYEDEDEARDSLEADTYTHGLTKWLHSSPARVGYLSDALEEYGGDLDGFQALAMAQSMEMWEVFDAVLQALEEVADELDAEA